MDVPRPTPAAPSDELLELVQLLRRELRRRDEAVTGNWVEETSNELHRGTKVGWYLPVATGGGLAFYSVEEHDAFGHVHVGPGPDAVERGDRLATTMLDALPSDVESIDVGFTGLTADDERVLMGRLARRPGSRIIERYKMERALGPADEEALPPLPSGVTLVPIRAVTVEAMADLDRRSFAGTVDELLIGPSLADYEEMLRALLDGKLGRFVDEASTAIIESEPPRLVGALLTGEESPQRAIFLDFMVDPNDRGHGYGRFLFRWGIRALRALGYSSVRLWVTSSNEPARRLYEAEGLRTSVLASIYRWDRPETGPHPQTSR